MAPLASRRRLQAGLELPRSFEVEKRGDLNGSWWHLIKRDDMYGDNSQGSPMFTPAAGAVLVVVLLIVLVGVLSFAAWLIRRPRRKRLSTLKPLKTAETPMSEKRQKAQSLPKIRIDPPTSAEIAVAIGTASSDGSMVEIQPPPLARIQGRRPTLPTDAQPFYLTSPEAGGRNPHATNHAISEASVLPSFYTVSGERPSKPVTSGHESSDEDPFADPPSDDSDAPALSQVPL